MAKREDTTNNVLRLADFRPIMDPVSKAQRGIDAGENDAAFECARDRFAGAQPKTLAGVHAKLMAIRATLTEVREGDILTELGWDGATRPPGRGRGVHVSRYYSARLLDPTHCASPPREPRRLCFVYRAISGERRAARPRTHSANSRAPGSGPSS